MLRCTTKNIPHLNHCFIISQQHVKNLVLHYFFILKYFDQCEDIFCHFWWIFLRYHGNGVPFFDILKTVNIYNTYLDTSHLLEGPFKILRYDHVSVNTCFKNLQNCTTSFIIFWDFLMFFQIFLPSQVKRRAIITYKHGKYELRKFVNSNKKLFKNRN